MLVVNKKSTLLIVFTLFISCVSFAYSGDISYTYTKSGRYLSNNNILSVTEDSLGLIWLCSASEIMRFDGVDFTKLPSKVMNEIIQNDNQLLSVKYINGNKLAICSKSGLFIYDIARHYLRKVPCFNDVRVMSVIPDAVGNLYLNTINGLYLYSLGRDECKMMTQIKDNNFDGYRNTTMSLGLDGNIFYSGRNSTVVLSLENGIINSDIFNTQEVVKYDTILRANKPVRIFADQWGYLWVWDRLQLSARKINKDKSFGEEIYSLRNTEISTVYHDSNGNTWVGLRAKGNMLISRTLTGGINSIELKAISNQNEDLHNTTNQYFRHSNGVLLIATRNGLFEIDSPKSSPFNYIRSGTAINSITHNTVSGLYLDGNNVLWVGTSGGLNRIEFSNLQNNIFSVQKYVDSRVEIDKIQENKIENIVRDDNGFLWIGTKGKVTLFDPVSCQFFDNPQLLDEMNRECSFARCIHKHNGDIWIGFESGGVAYYKKNSQKVIIPKIIIDGDKVNNCISIAVDKQNSIWIGTKNKGVLRFKFSNNKIEELEHVDIHGFGEDSMSVTKLFVDPSNNVWAGTSNGFFVFNRENNRFEHIPLLGEDNTYISGVTADNVGNIWISSLKGIYKYSVSGRSSFYYEINNDGFARADYVFNSISNNAGYIFMAGVNGLTYFSPEAIKDDTTHYNLLITDFSILNHNPDVGSGSLAADINYTDNVRLTHRDYQFSIEFSAMAFAESDKIKYRYKLEGLDRDWFYTGSERRYVSYNNLAAGRYKFVVQSTNTSGKWIENTKILNIEVLPSPWLSWWSFLVYLALAGVIVYLILRIWFRWNILKNRDDINSWRMKFYTSVSYSFKTPVTLMQAPLNNLIENYGILTEEEGRDMLLIMQRNCKRLAKQVEQLIEFRKIDDRKSSIRPKELDIISVIKAVCETIQGLSSAKGINVRFESNIDSVVLFFDPEKIETVMFNLISNAVKNIKSGNDVIVKCKVDSSQYRLWIEVSGVKYLVGHSNNNILRRFRQSITVPSDEEYGNEISMLLTKEFIELHKGVISFESTENNTGVYKFFLLLGESHLKHSAKAEITHDTMQTKDRYVDPIIGVNEVKSRNKKLPSISIISAESDTSYFIQKILSSSFNVYTYRDGAMFTNDPKSVKSAIVIIESSQTNKKDVMRFCTEIKHTNTLNHISVLVLGDSAEAKQEMYSAGADAYIIKPFSSSYIILRVNQMLEARYNIIEKAKKEFITTPKSIALQSSDEKFLAKAMEYLEKNIGDEAMSIDKFADSMNLSSSMLYRKIKFLTGVSPVEFIRSVRMKRAAQLLENETFSIAEIACKVGFSDTRYFSTCFKKMYGLTPSQYQQQGSTFQ